jgi:virginiamycin B lyase
MMTSPDYRRGLIMSPGTIDKLNAQERTTLAEYLAAHFGPQSQTRALEPDVEYPMDEQVVSRAMFVEYWLPADKPQSLPAYEPHLDNQGNIWFTSRMPGLGKLDPRTAEFMFYPYSDPKIFGHGLTVDSKGMVFTAEFDGFHLARLNPETKQIVRFPMDEKGEIKYGQGHTPALDSKENVWFDAITGNRIGKWDRKTEHIKLWEPPTANSFPYGFIVDKNDKIWFAELNGCNVGNFDPVTEKFKEYPSLSKPCKMRRLAADSNGTIWYSVTSKGKLGKLDPKTGKQIEYEILPSPSKSKILASVPYGIITDSENQVWFGDDAKGGALIRFNQKTEKFTYYPEPRPTDTPQLDVTRDGGIVYTARSNPQGAIGILYPDMSKMTTFAAYR